VERARRRDYEAFEALVALHRSRLYSLALHALQDSAAAEQVLEETFVAAWEGLPTLGDARDFSSWLVRLCGREIVLRVWKSPEPEEPAPARSPLFSASGELRRAPVGWKAASAQAGGALRRTVAAAVARLPTEHRLAFVLCSLGRASPAEAASALASTPETIGQRLHEACLGILEKIDASFDPRRGEGLQVSQTAS